MPFKIKGLNVSGGRSETGWRRPAGVNINTRNTAWTPSASMSSRFDLSKADAVPDALLNEVLWKSIRGEHSSVPAPRRSAFVKVSKEKGED